jgi:hypothetical protein
MESWRTRQPGVSLLWHAMVLCDLPGAAWTMGFVAYLRGAVTRWVDDAFPGWVEAQPVEADGTVVVLTDKVPVFGLDGLTVDTPLPAAVELACEVVRRERDRHDRELVVVVLSHGVMDPDGRSQFRVLADQVV